MSKNVVLTFDDGRKDQYTNAVRIMNKYHLKGTIFITTGFVEGRLDNGYFPSSGGESMSIDDIRQCITQGHEIGSHSDMHINVSEDIKKSLTKLREWTIDILPPNYKFGFASPSSDLYDKNISTISDIISELAYVRTSVQIRRNGIIYILLFLINKILKSNHLFWKLNSRYIQTNLDGLVQSVPVRSDTPIHNIKYLLETFPEDSTCVLLFHGVLSQEEKSKMKDCWYYPSDKFEDICALLKNEKYNVITLRDAMRREGVNNAV